MLRILFPFLTALLLFSSCADTASDAPGQGSLLLSVGTRRAATMRTALISSDNLQHVSYVQLYAFEGTTDDAPCVMSHNLGWTQPTGPTAQQTFQLPTTALHIDSSTPYTFLCVGLDNLPSEAQSEGAATAYHLPQAISIGSRLGDAAAHLASGLGAQDMARAELFAGTTAQVLEKGQKNLVSVDLYRRVAGVQVYVNDIPDGVTEVRLVLYRTQHSSVPLVKQTDDADGTFRDYATDSLLDSQTLLSLPVTSQTTAESEVEIADGGKPLVKQEGAIAGGAFVLPVEAPTAGATLRLQLYKGTALYQTYRVTIKETDGTHTALYPLRANCFYSLGQLRRDENDPVSLGEASSDITLEVEPNFEKDHEYDLQ